MSALPLRDVRELLPVCILAGGRGTRLGALTGEIPKPMVTVAGRPFIEHQLTVLRAHGARRVVVSVGYLGEVIEEFLGDGSRLGLEIAFSRDHPVPAGTAAAVKQALPLLGEEFLVLYGDTYLRIDYQDVVRAFRQAELPALMTILHNRDVWAPSNAIYRGGRVLAYEKGAPPPGAEWIDYGLSALHASALDADDRANLADVFSDLAASGQLAGYPAPSRFYEIGTPEALAETEAFLRGPNPPSGSGWRRG